MYLVILVQIILGILVGFFIPGFFVIWFLFPKKELTAIERFVFGFATSAGILDTIMILLAVLEYQITFVSVMSIELFVLLCIFTVWLFRIKKEGLPTLLSLKSSLKRAVKIRINVNFFTFTVFLVILLVVIEFFIFYSALITPVFTVWDALSLYAPYSKIIFLEKTVHWNEWVINGPLPTFEWYPELRNVIMFAVWGYTCNGSINENFAKIISPVFSVMILLLMIQFSKRIFKSTSVALSSAVILFYFSPDFVNRSQYFHVDIPFTFYWFCSTYVAYLFTLHKNWKYAILLGLLTGFTLLAKKVGILFILFLATLYFREILRKRDEKFARRFIGNTKLFMIIIVASAIIAGILYGKVWIVYGNPVYPLLWRFLDGRYIIPFIRETESQIEYEYLSPLSSDWFFLQISRLIRDSGFFFVIFCIIGALLFIKNYGRSDVQLFLMQTLIFISAWYFSGYGPRQLLPLFPFLAIYTGTFFKFEAKMKVKIWKSSSISLNVPVKKLVLVSFLLFSTALSIVFDQAIWQSITVHKYPWLNGFSNGLYLAAKGRNPSILYTFQNFTKPMDVETFSRYNFAFSDLREAWNYLNFKTPPNSTVLSMDNRIYFSKRQLITDTDYRVAAIYQVSTLADVLQILKSWNIRYIVVEEWMKEHPFHRLWNTILWLSLDDSVIFEKVFVGKYRYVEIYQIHYENV